MARQGIKTIAIRVIRVDTRMLVRADDGTYQEMDCSFVDDRAGKTYVDDYYMAELGPRRESILEVRIKAPVVDLIKLAHEKGWEVRSKAIEPGVEADV